MTKQGGNAQQHGWFNSHTKYVQKKAQNHTFFVTALDKPQTVFRYSLGEPSAGDIDGVSSAPNSIFPLRFLRDGSFFFFFLNRIIIIIFNISVQALIH